MITGYILLVLLINPPHMADVKLQAPAQSLDDCLVMGSQYAAQFANPKTVSAMVRCMPVIDKPSDDEHVD